jgi:dihydroorotase
MPSEVKTILIQGGILIDPTQNWNAPGDVLLEDGKIVGLEKPGVIPKSRAEKTIDAKGCWILPGLIDLHVHLREPGLEYKETIETGTLAAVAGGFTSVACMANTQPVNDNSYVTAFIRERAKSLGACRVFPIGAVTKGLRGEQLAEIGGMVAEGARAISDDGMPVMNSYLMRKAMDYARAFGIPVISHAEDWNLVGQGVMNESSLSNELGLRGNPAAAEEIMVAREIALCRLTRTPVHIAHISTEVALEHLRRAKDAGLPVTAEASPHHLTLTEECLRTYDTHFKMAPPLRSARDVEALQKAVELGWVEVIATDHAPHGTVDKAVEFDQAANGIIGLQTAVPVTLQLVHDKILSRTRWVESLTVGPAKVLGLPFGTLQLGREADVTLLNPDLEWTLTEEDIVSKSQNSPYLGHHFKGAVMATIVAGRIAYQRKGFGNA